MIVLSSIQQWHCRYDSRKRGAVMTGIVKIKSGSESDLEAAMALVGPVAAMIDGSSKAFRVSHE